MREQVEKQVEWTQSEIANLLGILFRGDCSSTETDIRRSCVARVITSSHNTQEISKSVEDTLREIADNNQFSNVGLIADCISCWRVHPVGYTVAADIVLLAISEKIKSGKLPMLMSEGILIGLIELYSDLEDDLKLFKALYLTQVYEILFFVRDQSVCVTKEGKGRLSNAIKSFLEQVWNAGGKFGTTRLIRTLLLLERWSRVYENCSGSPVPNLTHSEPVVLFEFFLSELSARLFLLADFKMRLDILATFTRNNESIKGSGGIEGLLQKYLA